MNSTFASMALPPMLPLVDFDKSMSLWKMAHYADVETREGTHSLDRLMSLAVINGHQEPTNQARANLTYMMLALADTPYTMKDLMSAAAPQLGKVIEVVMLALADSPSEMGDLMSAATPHLMGAMMAGISTSCNFDFGANGGRGAN